MATTKELHDLSLDDLARRAEELRATLFQDQLKLRTGALDNPSERTTHKRDLARVLTVITQKQKTASAKK
ncbi:MAG: 50S ribosomal protein L29 [Myxococcaceae bacterium]|jgi:large subunit ribosomal protein L29|nr:50S ribosomal protein L29 [Myxococcaceae bacterium]MCA3013383.1 50S ribosomal protein L29 [Myxococcaceae bacterium]